MTGPYREPPRMLACPRCGEVLDRGLDRIRSCLRCEGVWLPQATVTAAFDDPRWPGGQAIWWRSSIECPECAIDGVKQLLQARMAKGVLVDRCETHGVWLDPSELGRLMGTRGNELVELQRRLELPQADIEALAQRRSRWRKDLTTRREATSEYEQWLDEVQRQREEAVANALRTQRMREAEAAERAAQRAKEAVRAEQERARAAKLAAEETARRFTTRERAKQFVGNQLAEASEEHAKQDQQLAKHHVVMKQLEARLVEHRALGDKLAAELVQHREWLIKLNAALEQARVRVRALQDELAALEAQPV